MDRPEYEIKEKKPVVDWLTVVAIAAIAISFTVVFHEGVHALACIAVGDRLLEYSALYESCATSSAWQARIVAGSAPTFNLLAGLVIWIILRNVNLSSSTSWFFLWLLTIMNWFYGAGYFIFSGITNIGDWAVVIEGWEPAWLLRGLMALVGVVLYLVFINLALREFSRVIGGHGEEQLQRAKRLFYISYLTSFMVVLMAGLFCPYGMLSLPVTAGLMAVLGALSPLLGMIRWFQTDRFPKLDKTPMEIHRRWSWIGAAAVIVSTYVFVLGRTLYF